MTRDETVDDPPAREVRWERPLLVVGGLVLIAFLVYTAFTGERPVHVQRGIPFLLAAVLTFWVCPLDVGDSPWRRRLARMLNVLLIAGAVGAVVYRIVEQGQIALRLGLPTTLDLVLAAVGVLVTLEMSRRTLGWALPLIALGFLVYARLGVALPLGLGHVGFTWSRTLVNTWYGSDGVFGIPLGVMVNVIFLFVIFGALVKELGIAESFLALVYLGARKVGGGAGLVTVVGSLAFGTVSGSGIADAAAVGTFTMPMMRKAGYEAETAAIIQGLSSVGAQLVPPIMGASAFVIAALTGVPYSRVALVAIIPALLYYLCVTVVIMGRSSAEDVSVENVDFNRDSRRMLLDAGLFVLVVAWLIFRLANDANPQAAVSETGLLALALAALRRASRPTRRRLTETVVEGTRGALGLFGATAVVGIVVAVAGLTGLGNQVAELAGRAAGGSLILALVYTAVASVVLGTGLPTVAAYLLLAVLAAPAFATLGVPLLTAHFFIFFYGVTSDLSPPTALAPTAAAGIAGADLWKTMWGTLVYGLPIFFIPFILVLDPHTMLEGSLVSIVGSVILAATAVVAWSIGMGGHWRGRVAVPVRLLLIAGGLGILVNSMPWRPLGLAGVVTALAYEVIRRRVPIASTGSTEGPRPGSEQGVRERADG